MFATRFFSLFALATSASVLALSPGSGAVEAVAVKRQEVESINILNNLDVEIAPILAEIDTLVANVDVTEEKIVPLIESLTSKLDGAGVEIGTLATGSVVVRRASNQEVANVAAGLVNKIVVTLNGLVPFFSQIPLLQGLLFNVQGSLNKVLTGLGVVVQGVLELLGGLLSPIQGLLGGLGWNLLGGLLGGILGPILPLEAEPAVAAA